MAEEDRLRLANRTLADYSGFGYAPIFAGDLNAVATVSVDVANNAAAALASQEAAEDSRLAAEDAAFLANTVITPAYEIWLVIGQSNAQGRGTMDELIEMPNPRLWQWGATPPATEANARYQTIFSGADPLYHPQRINRLTGAASTFARMRLDALPASHRLLLVPLAWGGTALVASPARWSATGPGDLLANAVTQGNAALAAAKAVYPNSYIKGFIWQQGESDGDLAQATYADAQDAMLTYLRANVTGASEALFLVGGMAPERIAQGGAEIAIAHRETPARVLRAAYVDCPAGYTVSGDFFHASVRPGPQILGQRLYGAVVQAEANVLGSVPLAPGLPVISGVGNNHFTVTVPLPLSRVTNLLWEYRAGTSGSWTRITPSPASCYPSRLITGLTANTLYQVQVLAVNESGTGIASAIAAQTTANVSTLPVFNPPTVSSLTNTTASVSATLLSGTAATTVFAWYRTSETPVSPAGAWVSATSGASFPLSVTGLSAGTSYDFAASGNNAAGTGERSLTTDASTTGSVAAPSVPTDVTAGIVAPGQVDVFWRTNASGGRPTSAVVEYSTNGGASWLALPSGSSVGIEQASATGLPTTGTLSFRVRLANSGGFSSFVVASAAYWAEAVEIIAELAGEGDTLTSPQQDAVNNFIGALKLDGTWSKLGLLYIGFVSTAAAALVDWKTPNRRWSSNGTPGFTTDRGHVGDGSSGWLTLGDNWSAIPGVTQNSAHLCVFATCTTSIAALAGTNAGGVTRILKSANLLTTQINGTSTAAADAWGTGSTIALINRTESAGYDRYLNGSAATAATSVSSAPQNSQFVLLRSALSYAPNTATLHAASAGAGLTSGQATTLNTALRDLANAFSVP